MRVVTLLVPTTRTEVKAFLHRKTLLARYKLVSATQHTLWRAMEALNATDRKLWDKRQDLADRLIEAREFTVEHVEQF